MLPESERLPVDTQAFWRQRVLTAIATGKDLHTIIYNIDYDRWKEIQNETAGLLKNLIHPGEKVLDAGCGYGALFDVFQRPDDYVGIDLSPELIEIGKIRHPNAQLLVGDLRTLFYPDKFFDFVVCRSVEVMSKDNLEGSYWEDIAKELRRVGKKVLLMDYDNPVSCKELE